MFKHNNCNVLNLGAASISRAFNFFRNAFKARPVNDGVRPLKPLSVEKKLPTKPEPFKLTETRPKPAATENPEEDHVRFLTTVGRRDKILYDTISRPVMYRSKMGKIKARKLNC